MYIKSCLSFLQALQWNLSEVKFMILLADDSISGMDIYICRLISQRLHLSRIHRWTLSELEFIVIISRLSFMFRCQDCDGLMFYPSLSVKQGTILFNKLSVFIIQMDYPQQVISLAPARRLNPITLSEGICLSKCCKLHNIICNI